MTDPITEEISRKHRFIRKQEVIAMYFQGRPDGQASLEFFKGAGADQEVPMPLSSQLEKFPF